jgi:hypothetical protein
VNSATMFSNVLCRGTRVGSIASAFIIRRETASQVGLVHSSKLSCSYCQSGPNVTRESIEILTLVIHRLLETCLDD